MPARRPSLLADSLTRRLAASNTGQPRRAFTQPGLSSSDKRTRKPNSVLCGHSSRRRVAADAHQRPTRRFRALHAATLSRSACRSPLNASGRRAAPPGSGRTLPSLFGLAPCGVYPATGITASAVRSYRTFSPLPDWPFRRTGLPRSHFCCMGRERPSGQLARAEARDTGGIFSVALAVHGPSRPRPGRYPAHCPAEFGLSSPDRLRVPPKRPAATARFSCHRLVYREFGARPTTFPATCGWCESPRQSGSHCQQRDTG